MSRRFLSLMLAILLLSSACGPAAVEVTDDLEVTFDGTSCIYDGPTVIQAGDVVFVMDNQTEEQAVLVIDKLDDGKTWQEYLDLIGVPGSYVMRPSWSTPASKIPDISDPDRITYSFESGNYAMTCLLMSESGFGTYPGSGLEVR